MISYDYNTEIDEVLSNMVEVTFPEGNEEGFRKTKETLERMGVSSNQTSTIYQSAHVFHKRDKYYICHFKELFALDGKKAELSDDDVGRRNLIIKYLVEWGLVTPKSSSWKDCVAHPSQLKVIKYGDRHNWTLESKYAIGTHKRA